MMSKRREPRSSRHYSNSIEEKTVAVGKHGSKICSGPAKAIKVTDRLNANPVILKKSMLNADKEFAT